MPRPRSERERASDLAYRQATARSRAWAIANPEKRRETERKYRTANRDKITAQKREWRRKNRDLQQAASKRWRISRRLKLSEFDALIEKQVGRCAICELNHAARNGSGRLSIDHDHVTGRVRGLLCHRCNSLLGHAKDSIETLRKAIAYLEASR